LNATDNANNCDCCDKGDDNDSITNIVTNTTISITSVMNSNTLIRTSATRKVKIEIKVGRKIGDAVIKERSKGILKLESD
jgi:hypothetical protein